MALSIIGTPQAAAATSITLPTHAVGDLIVIWAYRDGSATVPSKPAASGTVPAWVDIDAPAGANTNSARSAYFVATATNHTSGTWTSSTGMAAIVLRGQLAGSTVVALGAHGQGGSTATNSATAPAVTLQQADGTDVILEFYGHRAVTAWSAAPSGYTRQASVATETCLNTKNATTTDGSIAQANTASSSGYRGQTVEVLAEPGALATDLVDTTSFANGGATTLTTTAPTHSSGDLLLLCGYVDSFTGTVSTPTGWTEAVPQATETTQGFRGFLFMRVADGTATDTPVVSWDGSSHFGNGTMSRVTGADTTTPVALASAAFTDQTVAVAGQVAAALTSPVANTLAIAFGIADTSDAVASWESGWSKDSDTQFAPRVMHKKSLVGNGASSSTATFTSAGGNTSLTAMVLVQPPQAVVVPLNSSAAQSAATLALTAATRVPLGTSAAQSAATVALAAPTRVPLQTSVAVGAASLALNAPTKVALGASAGLSTASLSMTIPVPVPLQSSAAVSTTSLALTALTQVPLQASAGLSTTSLAVTALTRVPLNASAATSTTSLGLTAPTRVPLQTSTAQSTSSLSLTALTFIPLGQSNATATTSLSVTTPGAANLALNASQAVSSTQLALAAQTTVPLGAAGGLSAATLGLSAPALLPFQSSVATSIASLVVSTPTGGIANLPLQASHAASSGSLTVTSGVMPERWPASTDAEWRGDTGERWPEDEDDTWLVTTEAGWPDA